MFKGLVKLFPALKRLAITHYTFHNDCSFYGLDMDRNVDSDLMIKGLRDVVIVDTRYLIQFHKEIADDVSKRYPVS